MKHSISKKPILLGDIFSNLKVVAFSGKSKNGHYLWRCLCTCGKESVYFASNLRRGLSTGCTLCMAKKTGLRATKHGKYKTKVYASWQKAKNRCTNKLSKDYPLYGGRGIRMCEEWLRSFEAFYEHMGDRPEGKFSLERIDNNKGYQPGNCRWATDFEQSNNKRNNMLLTLGPCTLTIHQWFTERPMIPVATVRARVLKGWSHSKALLTPVKKH